MSANEVTTTRRTPSVQYSESTESASKQCTACGTLPSGEHVLAGDAIYCQGCLTCCACGASISNGTYYLNPEPTCAACHESLHQCKSCKKGLFGKYIVTGDGDKFHEECRPTVVCAGCGEPVSGTVKSANGKQWHFEGDGFSCFKCAGCGDALSEKFFKKPDGNDAECFCAKCAEVSPGAAAVQVEPVPAAPPAAATEAASTTGATSEAAAPDVKPTCTKCGEELRPGEAFFKLEGKPMHKDCLKCDACAESVFAGSKLEMVDGPGGAILCPKCSNLGDGVVVPCDACTEPIPAGAFVRWGTPSQKLHASCLKCSACDKGLKTTDSIFAKDNKPLCGTCV